MEHDIKKGPLHLRSNDNKQYMTYQLLQLSRLETVLQKSCDNSTEDFDVVTKGHRPTARIQQNGKSRGEALILPSNGGRKATNVRSAVSPSTVDKPTKRRRAKKIECGPRKRVKSSPITLYQHCVHVKQLLQVELFNYRLNGHNMKDFSYDHAALCDLSERAPDMTSEEDKENAIKESLRKNNRRFYDVMSVLKGVDYILPSGKMKIASFDNFKLNKNVLGIPSATVMTRHGTQSVGINEETLKTFTDDMRVKLDFKIKAIKGKSSRLQELNTRNDLKRAHSMLSS